MRNVTRSSRKDADARNIRRSVQLVTFAAVSAGCTAAAVATGTYAIWLSRHRSVEETVIDVHDLLESCRDRVTRMEADMNQLSASSHL